MDMVDTLETLHVQRGEGAKYHETTILWCGVSTNQGSSFDGGM